jgi:shikimate kinase
MNIALIGYRGTGKSTIGRLAAESTDLELANLDALIIEKAGMSIPMIVENFGWDQFRDIETQVLEETVEKDNLLLDCGGGIILRPENREILLRTAEVFWLTASVETIARRISDDNQRPSLTGKSFVEEIAEVLKEREPLYRRSSAHVIDTDAMDAKEAARRILGLSGLGK